MCEILAEYFKNKLYLISIILNVLPKIENNKIIKHSYCSYRLHSLENFEFCIPKDFRITKLNPKELIEKLIKYINNFNCEDKWIINNSNRNNLIKNIIHFNYDYFKNLKEIYDNYYNTLEELIKIISILEKNITVEELDNIMKKTSELLHEMFNVCQINYIKCVLIVIYNNSNMNQNLKKELENFLK